MWHICGYIWIIYDLYLIICDLVWLIVVQIIHIIQIIEIEASGANNPDYVDYKRHSKATMWLLISRFLTEASMWIIWIGYYRNCSHIQSTMWILFVSHAKCCFKPDYVTDYKRNQNKPHICDVASALL